MLTNRKIERHNWYEYAILPLLPLIVIISVVCNIGLSLPKRRCQNKIIDNVRKYLAEIDAEMHRTYGLVWPISLYIYLAGEIFSIGYISKLLYPMCVELIISVYEILIIPLLNRVTMVL